MGRTYYGVVFQVELVFYQVVKGIDLLIQLVIQTLQK